MKEKVNFKETYIKWEGKEYYLRVCYHTEGGGVLIEVGDTRKVKDIVHRNVYWAQALRNLPK